MAALAEEKKQNKNGNEWHIESYNQASQTLFQSAEEDLDDFNLDQDKYIIIKVQRSTLQFPHITCPQVIITFYSNAEHYNKYPLKLEVTYQYKTSLMLSTQNNVDFSSKEHKEIRIRPRIKGILYHFNFSDGGGLLSGYQHSINSQNELDSLKKVFIAVYNIIANPIVPVAAMYPLDKLEHAWKEHQDDSCPCQFYRAMPTTWNIYSNSKNEARERLIQQLRENLKKQMLSGYTEQQNKINTVLQKYKPLYPWLWNAEWDFEHILHPEIVKVFNDEKNGRKLFMEQLVKPEIEERVYSFPFFRAEFCDELVAELRNYEQTDGLPKDRPNSMNNYGVILNYIGLEPFVTDLFETYLTKIAQWLYPSNIDKHDEELPDEDLDFTHHGTLDHHHTFMVQYKMDADLFLDMHIDDSEVTFNVNLLDEFTGAELAICGLAGEKKRRNHLLSYNHKKGRCLVHAGQQRHGARAITAGERQNLIVWCRSSWYRTANPHGSGKCACCKYRGKAFNDPDAICLSKTHDRDYDKWVDQFSNQSVHKENNFTIENELDDTARAAQADDMLVDDGDAEGKQDDNPLL